MRALERIFSRDSGVCGDRVKTLTSHEFDSRKKKADALATREKSAIDLEGRILGGGTNQLYPAVLDIWEK